MSLSPTEPNTEGGQHLKIWNCVSCRRRKVRCDRRHPCAQCTRNKIDCVFPISGRLPSRSRIGGPAAQKQIQLVGRLRRLEAMVGGLSSQVENAAGLSQKGHDMDSSTAATGTTSSENDSGFSKDTSEPLHEAEDFGVLEVASNGDLVVGEGFWTVFCKEVEDIFEAVQGHTVMKFDDGSSSSMSDVSPHTGYYNFLLRSTTAARQKKDVYPLPSQMLFLWQIYKDNVDPFVKILHKPTMAKVIREIRSNYDSLGPSMRALVLAISLAAIMSLEDEEVNANFNADKLQLMAQYRLGTELALEQADFLNNPDLNVLQGLTIYLSVLQYTGEARAAWFLAGVLVRLAVSIKLHLDGSKVDNITPFEVEIRRRLWWQICFIDSKSVNSQVSAFKISEHMFHTELPTNTDDANLDPTMSELPVNTEGWTDMTAFLLRCETWRLSHRLQSIGPAISDIIQRHDIFMKTQTKLESMYLKHHNPNQRLQVFVVTSVWLFFTKVKLILSPEPFHSDGAPTSPTPPPMILALSTVLIENTSTLQNDPGWNGYRWQIQGRQPPWNALRLVLDYLRTVEDWQAFNDRALRSAKQSLQSLPEAVRSDPRYQQLLVLLSTAQERAEEYHHRGDQQLVVHDDPIPLINTNQATPLEENGSSGHGPYGISQELFLDTTEYSGADMDWQAWGEIAGDLEFWDMSSL